MMNALGRYWCPRLSLDAQKDVFLSIHFVVGPIWTTAYEFPSAIQLRTCRLYYKCKLIGRHLIWRYFTPVHDHRQSPDKRTHLLTLLGCSLFFLVPFFVPCWLTIWRQPSAMTDLTPSWRKENIKINFDLSPGERVWRGRQKMLERHGYLLRVRFRHEWVPSWLNNGKSPLQCKDGIINPVCTLFLLHASC